MPLTSLNLPTRYSYHNIHIAIVITVVLDWIGLDSLFSQGRLYLMATTLGTLRIVQKKNSRKNENTAIDVEFE